MQTGAACATCSTQASRVDPHSDLIERIKEGSPPFEEAEGVLAMYAV
jgi:hypothetical protein